MATPSLTPALARALLSARRLSRPVLAKLEPTALRVRRTWRRSLQLRMVTITVVASGMLVTGFGFLAADRNNTALVNAARADAMVRLDAGAKYLAEQLGPGLNSQGEDEAVTKALALVAPTPEQGSGVIVVVKFSYAANGRQPVVWPPREENAGRSVITTDLERSVINGQISSQVAEVGDKIYMVVGTPVYTPATANQSYPQVEFYYAAPMDPQVNVAEDFRVTMGIIGTALVLLLCTLVVSVTRLVTQPVRLAAQTAQRLSAGLLDQRMTVKGEDELALLADAFNQMAANLQRQIVRLEEMSRIQRRFTSDVSHELRTPLTTVRMAADMIYSQRDQFDPVVARSAELLATELDRFEELLTDLLEISRFDAGFAMLEAEPTDLVALVTRAADRLKPVAKRAGVDIHLVVPPPPVIAEVDGRRIERVLRNLLDNAIDHAEGKPVVITLGSDPKAVAVTVRDHGMGLRPGDEKQVFNRFWRADPSRARHTGGTGLGLSISIEDARLHGGWLEAWGSPGEGACFRLTLPVRAGTKLHGSPLPLAPQQIPAQFERTEVVA